MTYTKEELDRALGKIAMGAELCGAVLSPRESKIVVTEIAALRQACDCYDGSKGIAMANAVAAREARERHQTGDQQ